MAASLLHTARKWGPDRVAGFSPIPAMSYFSYAAGSRFLTLFGGVIQSFYDWYADLPNAFPEIWGDQTDVCESADWFNSRYIVSMGSNLSMTRTPDVHFIVEARHEGAKFVVLAPDFSQVSKYADWWLPVESRGGRGVLDGGGPRDPQGVLRGAAGAVLYRLPQAFHRCAVPRAARAPRRYASVPDRLLKASHIEKLAAVENAAWKTLVWDGAPRMPKGTVGLRWGEEKGKWNLKSEDGLDDSPLTPLLTFLDDREDVLPVEFSRFRTGEQPRRGACPCATCRPAREGRAITTVFDLLAAELGVDRGLPGEYPKSYDEMPSTPPPGRSSTRASAVTASSAWRGSSPPTPRQHRAGR